MIHSQMESRKAGEEGLLRKPVMRDLQKKGRTVTEEGGVWGLSALTFIPAPFSP